MNGPDPTFQAADVLVDLRILATTDLHMHLLPQDDFTGRPAPGRGLAGVATLVDRERATHPNTVLLDNGDVLNGSPAAEFLDPRLPHPMIAAMNACRYDAATLGNHDFDAGPAALVAALAQARFPFAVTNAALRGARGRIAPFVVLDRHVTDRAGTAHPLRIGVMGFLPPRTVAWNPGLAARLRITDPVEAARAAIPLLRRAGADVIVALCHSGIGAGADMTMTDDAAVAVACLDGVDAVVAGHTHAVFPGPDHAACDKVDPVAGTLGGKPAVMPGFWGSHLGIIDLALRRDGTGWRVAEGSGRIEPAGDAPPAPLPAPALHGLASAAARMQHRLARTARPIHNHFALLGHDPATGIVAAAQRWHVRRALRGRPASMPVLSAAAPGRAGGRSGPHHYTDIPPGPITALALSDLCPWPNRLCAVELTGADAADWLERASSIFARLRPGAGDHPLIDPRFPGYNFDVIHGLTWRIDPSQPARYGPNGELIDAAARRITGLRHLGTTVAPEDRFILATHGFRLADGGLFGPLAAGLRTVLVDGPPVRDVLRRYLGRRRRLDDPAPKPWRFAPLPGTTTVFDTGTGALAHLPDLDVPCEPVGTTSDGFFRLRVGL